MSTCMLRWVCDLQAWRTPEQAVPKHVTLAHWVFWAEGNWGKVCRGSINPFQLKVEPTFFTGKVSSLYKGKNTLHPDMGEPMLRWMCTNQPTRITPSSFGSSHLQPVTSPQLTAPAGSFPLSCRVSPKSTVLCCNDIGHRTFLTLQNIVSASAYLVYEVRGEKLAEKQTSVQEKKKKKKMGESAGDSLLVVMLMWGCHSESHTELAVGWRWWWACGCVLWGWGLYESQPKDHLPVPRLNQWCVCLRGHRGAIQTFC